LVSAQTLLIISGIVLFLVAGGGSLIRPALAQGREDISKLRTEITQLSKRTEQDKMNISNNPMDRAGEMIF